MAIKITVGGGEASVEGDGDSMSGNINISGGDMVISGQKTIIHRTKKVVKSILLECTHCETTRVKGKNEEDGEIKCKSCGASKFRRADVK